MRLGLALAVAASSLVVIPARAVNGGIADVTIDYVPALYSSKLYGYSIRPNETITIQGYSDFTVTVRSDSIGTAPWLLKLTSPAGKTLSFSMPNRGGLWYWTWSGDFGRESNPVGVWTAQVDDGPTLSWTIAYLPSPEVTALTTSPSSPKAGEPFELMIDGAKFAPNARFRITGPGCTTGCTISALTTRTETRLAAPVTLEAAGLFQVAVVSNDFQSNQLPFTVAEGSPSVTSVSILPTVPAPGQQYTLTVMGARFDPATAQVAVTGPGCAPCIIANSALTTKTATTLAGPLLTGAGVFTASVRNGSTGAESNGVSFSVQNAAPIISSVTTSPAVVYSGQPFTLTVTGLNFDPELAGIVLSGNSCEASEITGAALTTRTATTLSGVCTAPTYGTLNIRVRNGSNGPLSNNVSIFVNSSQPVLTAISTSPYPPLAGQPFTLNVSGVAFDPASAEIIIAGITAPECAPCTIANSALTVKLADHLAGTVTLNALGSYSVSVRSGGIQTASQAFNVQASPPVMKSLTTSPERPLEGQEVTLTVTGSNFDPAADMIVSTMGGAFRVIPNAELTGKSSTSLTGRITLGAGDYGVAVRNPGGAESNAVYIHVRSERPQLSHVSASPDFPAAGQTFTIKLSGTDFDPATALILISGPGCEPCTVPNSALTQKTEWWLAGPVTLARYGSFTVAVRNGESGSQSDGLPLTVQSTAATPYITAVFTSPAPPLAGQGFMLTVSGNDFDPATALIIITGPGCTDCVLANDALTTKTATSLAASFTATEPGEFAVRVRNGEGTTLSGGRTFRVAGLAPTLRAVAVQDLAIVGIEFRMELSGYDFDPVADEVVVTGPGCNPCVIPNSALTSKTATHLSAHMTVTGSGSFQVYVRHGEGGPRSNTVNMTAQTTAATAIGISTAPSAPLAGRPFTLTVTGANFDSTAAQLVLNGPGCAPCITGAAALAAITLQSLTASLTLAQSGDFSVFVQNGSTAASKSFTFTVGSTQPVIERVISAASMNEALTRGTTAYVVGRDLATVYEVGSQSPLNKSIAGVSVEVNGVQAQLWYVSSNRICFRIPAESPAAGAVSVVVAREGVRSESVSVSLQSYAPDVYTYVRPDGVSDPLVLHADGSLVTPENPAGVNADLTLWTTGLGETPTTPIVMVGGVAAELRSVAPEAGGVGLTKVVIRLASVPVGTETAELVMQAGGVSSAPVKLAVAGGR